MKNFKINSLGIELLFIMAITLMPFNVFGESISNGWITSNSTFSVAADLPFAVLADVNSDGHIDAVALGYNNDVATIATNYPTFTYITNTSGSGLELMQ
jgi:hypothetical protein